MEEEGDYHFNAFTTHIACTDNVKAKNSYWKINNQAIYNGSVNTFKSIIVVTCIIL
jgi:hypothetical protein